MKKLMVMIAVTVTGFAISANAGELKGVTVKDLTILGKLMKDWYQGSEIISLIAHKDEYSRSYELVSKSDGICLFSVIGELDLPGKPLYTVPSSVEEVPCE
ncbi:hypothetical protein [Bdellovibrio sp. HCB274]|uniref:hypothetical protein n=1 Tax=Bdellovibrio sp. HCB274 TaxID=3394361 RepID=UPI0039B61B27